MTNSNLNALVEEFFQNLGFLKLVNAGRSMYSRSQDTLVKNMFDLAYEVLSVAHKENKKDTFQRIYNISLKEIVPSEAMKQVMEYPEKYDIMTQYKEDFVQKTAALKQKRFNLLFSGRRR